MNDSVSKYWYNVKFCCGVGAVENIPNRSGRRDPQTFDHSNFHRAVSIESPSKRSTDPECGKRYREYRSMYLHRDHRHIVVIQWPTAIFPQIFQYGIFNQLWIVMRNAIQ